MKYNLVENPRVAFAYARYSSNNQREESIDAQLRAIREHCRRNQIHLMECFIDEAQTGKNDQRDSFQRMISGIIKGHYKVDAVYVHKFNRFARNQFESALNKKRLKEVGVRVISVTQNIENTPEGQMLESFLEAMDEYYSANLAQEVRKGLRENALKGKHAGGRVPFGFSLVDGYYKPNKDAGIVRRIFEEYAAGEFKTDIVDRLNFEGYRNQAGNLFNVRTVYDMLRNEKYCGNYIYTMNGNETIRIDGIIEPIIDIELWDKVQRLCNLSIQPRKTHSMATYLLTGKTFCGCCGEHISGNGSKRSGGKLIKYYKCVGKTKNKNGCQNGSLNKEWFEKSVLESVIDSMDETHMMHIAKETYSEIQAMKDVPAVSTSALKKELTKLMTKKERLTELYLDGEIEKDVLNAKNAEIKRKQADITHELEKRKAAEQADSIDLQSIYNYIKRYFEFVKDTGNADEDEFMKTIFHAFVDKIVVSEKEITVFINADFSFYKMGDSKQISGIIRRLSPVKMQRTFRRKLRYKEA